MFEFSLLSAAKEERPASSCPSAIFGKIGKNSPNLAGMILHNSVEVSKLEILEHTALQTANGPISPAVWK